MSETKQLRFDGGAIDDEILGLRRAAREVFGLSRADAVELIADDDDARPLRYLNYLAADLEVGKIESVNLAEYPHEFDLLIDVGPTAWFVGECELSLREAMDFAPLGFQLDEIEIPKRVVEAVENPREWMDRLDEAFSVRDSGGDDVFWLIPKGKDRFTWIDDFGHSYYEDAFEFVDGDYLFWADDDDARDPPFELVHRDSMWEYSDNISVVGHAGKVQYNHLDGVISESWHESTGEYDDLVRAVVSRNLDDVGYVSVAGGWHSSMERSDLSERINSLTRGEGHENGELDYPVVVKFGKTTNVCSLSISIYAHPDDVDMLEGFLDARAAPAYAGF
ncbi:hypothetical protein [Halobellus limi]|uniref:Uncharacterized protein n=1 Tax=Halobellus limi TaxID=699433 RepID=A0A1H5ZHT2_9EURY|nr:hypothetical protein [Halobellus limi]QCC48110.1 hypothetical protein DV707_10800 [Halobellus limi]SEG35197.1 hypothetical protein SAMN04488133_1982 [Halobellus limi]